MKMFVNKDNNLHIFKHELKESLVDVYENWSGSTFIEQYFLQFMLLEFPKKLNWVNYVLFVKYKFKKKMS